MLLRFYPRGYRRERGREMVDTFLDAGRVRPSFREALNLMRHGMRARLGRPQSRGVVVWAAMFSAMCGLFTASAAIWLAWGTARPLPDRAETSRIVGTAFPGRDIIEVYRSPDLFAIDRTQRLSVDNFHWLFFEFAGEYEFGATAVRLYDDDPFDTVKIMAAAGERMRANGWQVDVNSVGTDQHCADSRCDPAKLSKDYRLVAHRDDTIIELKVMESVHPALIWVELQRATPGAAHPAGVAAGLLGALAGWMVFGWASRRTEGGYLVVRALAGTFFTATMFMWGVPIPFGLQAVLRWQSDKPSPRWYPLWEWVGQPYFGWLFLVGCGTALLGLASAALPRRRAFAQHATRVRRG
ncbi:MAG TPA: hypothetical protein VFC19_15085 [Candidatus Limnocylindrales bacterium]|nr:hypothetical protein [Candidatus Limnocylindrales bacterium]